MADTYTIFVHTSSRIVRINFNRLTDTDTVRSLFVGGGGEGDTITETVCVILMSIASYVLF